MLFVTHRVYNANHLMSSTIITYMGMNAMHVAHRVSESLVQNENVSADKNLIILSLFTACLGHWQSQSKTKTHDDVMCRCSINTDIVASHTFKV